MEIPPADKPEAPGAPVRFVLSTYSRLIMKHPASPRAMPGQRFHRLSALVLCVLSLCALPAGAQHFDCIELNDGNTNIFMTPDLCFNEENLDWCNCVDSALTHPVRGETSGFRQAIQWLSGQPGIGNARIEIEGGSLDLSTLSPGQLIGTGEAMELIPLGFPFVGGDFFGVQFEVRVVSARDNTADFHVSITSVTPAVEEAIGYNPTDREHSDGHLLTGRLTSNAGGGAVIDYRYATESFTADTVPALLPTEAAMPTFTVPFVLEFFSRESGIYTVPDDRNVQVLSTIRSFLEDTVDEILPLDAEDLCEGVDDFTHCKMIEEDLEIKASPDDNNPPTAIITAIDAGIFLMLEDPVTLDTFCGRAYVLLRGRNSDDGDGGYQGLTYRWSILEGPEEGAEIPANTHDFMDTHVIFTEAGVYEIGLTVDDGQDADSSSEATISVVVSTELDFNAPPLIGLRTSPAPPDVQLAGGSASVTLDASNSDGGGEGCEQEISFLWRQLGGPVDAVIRNPREAVTQVVFDTAGAYLFEIEVDDGGFQDNISVEEVEVIVTAAAVTGGFRRGDADDSGRLNITDAITVLNWLFLGSATPSCTDAADADDNGRNNITDAIQLLQFLFLGGPPPPAPGRDDCGVDPTADALSDCDYQSCGD